MRIYECCKGFVEKFLETSGVPIRIVHIDWEINRKIVVLVIREYATFHLIVKLFLKSFFEKELKPSDNWFVCIISGRIAWLQSRKNSGKETISLL
ncbi:MAG: hypothetical protein PWQ63_116 [Methanolobus sp.]|nr:hypothetical protein [Methanolobus sp.]MDK2946956.1 hypothetical protein [Methanolobus sp.]